MAEPLLLKGSARVALHPQDAGLHALSSYSLSIDDR